MGHGEASVPLVCVPLDDSLLEGIAEADCDMTERVMVAKCYSKIETSTAQNQIRKLVLSSTEGPVSCLPPLQSD